MERDFFGGYFVETGLLLAGSIKTLTKLHVERDFSILMDQQHASSPARTTQANEHKMFGQNAYLYRFHTDVKSKYVLLDSNFFVHCSWIFWTSGDELR